MKIIPDTEDIREIERRYGPLPCGASNDKAAERYRLAQAVKLLRLHGPQNAPAIIRSS
jgi:hypothetical protein